MSGAGIEKILFFFDATLHQRRAITNHAGSFFPGGVGDIQKLATLIREHGMIAGVYASYCICLAWKCCTRENHLDWECCDANGMTFDSSGCCNMCFLSKWGDYFKEKCSQLIDLGFSEIQLDGPTEIPCYQKGHNHTTQGNYQYRNWKWEMSLFESLRNRDVVFTIPLGINYLLMGASAIPGGYCEEDFCHSSGQQLLTNYRSSIYTARQRIPAWCTWGFLSVGNYHGNNIEASEDTPVNYEHGLASLLGYGQSRSISGSRPCFGPITAEILKRWVTLFKKYRHIFSGDFNGLQAPNGVDTEAVLWTCEDTHEALLILLNPVEQPVTVNLLLPLGRARIIGNCTVVDEQSNESTSDVTDSRGNYFFTTTLAGGQVKVLHGSQTI